VSSNGSTPNRARRRRPLPRRARLVVGGVSAIVIAVVLVAPVVLDSGGSKGGQCAQTLAFAGEKYVARAVKSSDVKELRTLGVGVSSGCGFAAQNVDLLSLDGVQPAVAVGLVADQSAVYVRPGVCAGVGADALMACLERRSGH